MIFHYYEDPGTMTARSVFELKYRTFSIISIIACGIIIYRNTLFSSFHFDDLPSIVQNPAIRNILDLKTIWDFWPSRFITYLSFALNYHFHQLDVTGYHLFNIALHTGSAILIWWLMLITFSTPAMRNEKISEYSRRLSLFAGLVFVSHPAQTQAVTYIIQRAASLAALLYIGSLGCYVRARLLQQQGQTPKRSLYFFCLSLLTGALAMFTKEMAISLPFIVLLYEICFLKTKKITLQYPLIYFLTVAVIPLTYLLTGSVNLAEMRRTIEPPAGISSAHYLLTQFRVIVTYARLAILPFNQNFIYDYPVARSLFEWPVAASLIFVVSLITTACALFRKFRFISFGVFWFLMTLAPESSIFPIKDVIFEHRLYLPIAGFCFFMANLIYRLFRNKHRSMVVTMILIVFSYGIMAYCRNNVWQDELTLWNDVARKSPGKASAYACRGDAHMENGDLTLALTDYDRALKIDPGYADTYINRANIHREMGNFEQALADYNNVIEIAPRSADAYNNRGNLYESRNDIEQALADYNKAIEIDPRLSGAYNNRGNLYKKLGDIERALADYDTALSIDRNLVSAYNNRGNINKNMGNIEQALSDYSKAIEIDSGYIYAYRNRAVIYYMLREYDNAWLDIHRLVLLGYTITAKDEIFIEQLKKDSGKIGSLNQTLRNLQPFLPIIRPPRNKRTVPIPHLRFYNMQHHHLPKFFLI